MGLGGKTVGMWCRGRGGEGEVVYRRAMGHTATTRIMGLPHMWGPGLLLWAEEGCVHTQELLSVSVARLCWQERPLYAAKLHVRARKRPLGTKRRS